MENCIGKSKSRFELETKADKEKQEMGNKTVKAGVALIICLVLLNFVLVVVVIVMSRTSEFENKNRELQKSHEELKQQFDSLSLRFGQLESNISFIHGILLGTPPAAPDFRRPSAITIENKAQDLIDPQSPKSCSDAVKIFSFSRSKKQTIYPHGNRTSLEILCDFETDGGGWTIIQKRSSGPKHEFNKTWTEYENGFGSLSGNFWLGLENIHALTKNGDQELRIDLEDFEGRKTWAKYSSFSISDASDFYRLTIGWIYTNSTAGDSMTNRRQGSENNGSRFSTKDEDNDSVSHYNCAVAQGGGGGWWFNMCSWSNLNGLYFEKGEKVPPQTGVYWFSWRGEFYSLAKSEMKIRARKPESESR